MSVPKGLEELLLKAANQQDIVQMAIPSNISQMYSKDVNFEKAAIQLQMIPDVVKSYKQSKRLRTLEVTSMRTIADILNGVYRWQKTCFVKLTNSFVSIPQYL